MARPKAEFFGSLAEQAKSDMQRLDGKKVVVKLQAIVSMAKYPVELVAEIIGVTAQTLWRWASAYRKHGVEGLCPKAKKPKPSKLTAAQKAEVLGWVDTAKTAEGEGIHWTLERLRCAIEGKFGVVLGINTIWVWLRKEGRKPKVPRPRHYLADEEAQEAFKKNSRRK
jgi:transposase